MGADRDARLFDPRLRADVPGPHGIPVVNNIRFWSRQLDYSRTRLAQYGDRPVVGVTGGNGSMVVVRGSEAARQVLTDNTTFEHPSNSMLGLPPGRPYSTLFDATATLNGARNVRSRKLLMPVMHRSALKEYDEVFAENFARSRFARPGEPFDLVAELDRLTNANMLTCLIGLGPQDAPLGERVTRLLHLTMDPRVFLFKRGQRTPYGRWLELVASVHQELSELIDRNRDKPPKVDALSILCHATDEDGRLMSTAEIVGELNGMLASGYLTTSASMGWALIALAGSSSVREAARGSDEYLEAVIKETQRVIPTVPMSLPRRVVSTVDIGGTDVPAGALLFLATYLEHHNADVFDRPDEFRPERWADARPTPFEFFPFGAGARRCLGAAFADLQMRTTLRQILQTGVPELLTARLKHHMVGGVVAAPKGPLLIRIAPGAAARDSSDVLTRFWNSLAVSS
ncbi:cytochrome P450 [Kribbella sp. NPDC006257]|uniref:cytochrome P450 n=1 Tax=Kribbella sp. NPDC006257 TaxID=3156738 RepID=UPI0033B6F45C